MTAGFYVLGGSSVVIENLANQLSKNGVDVTIAAIKYNKVPKKDNYTVTKLPVCNLKKLKGFLDSFDVIHNHHSITNFLALATHTPFIYHYHGAPDIYHNYPIWLSSRARALISVKITHQSFKAIIAVSETGAKEIKPYINTNNVSIVYNGVDTRVFNPQHDGIFREGTPQFLFVGNLSQHKNVKEIVFGLQEVLKTYPNAKLQIIGVGSKYYHLKRLVEEFGLKNEIHMIGFVSDYELPYYYASCDVYVSTSRWENFGMPLLEAMASGKPIVASSIPAHKEILTKSEAGELYKTGDVKDLCNTMIKVYENNKKYTKNCLSFSKRHDWINVADEVLKIYNHVINSS